MPEPKTGDADDGSLEGGPKALETIGTASGIIQWRSFVLLFSLYIKYTYTYTYILQYYIPIDCVRLWRVYVGVGG